MYEGGGGVEWMKALERLGTDADKPHLTVAPWLTVVFAQRWGVLKMAPNKRTSMFPKV